ncbi:peptidoglycan DD-metalloendopeptidase family protein [Tessaracoccus sp. OS52]|uniref:M23 family metallopeptidase n=1 Tax=Tessaracoccus sp. OS52 TaxID=2886691 RepID=UPI001D11481E|nr:peptidoglycan DD-metalloendopeptidase family protein [Tessaracoccus sp. OS52]MCC2592304.1 peptidoglycan DD-metalloendopeptidase family protein [Tessaracoccus sp. OS52]
MKTWSTPEDPRRAAVADPVEPGTIEPEVVLEPAAKTARGLHRAKLGRGAVGAVLAGILAAGSLFGYSFSQRGASEDLSSENVAVDAAIPAAAADAAAKGFADRTQDASRNAVRDGLTVAVAGEAAKQREAALDAVAEEANDTLTEAARTERDAQMDADLKLVQQQAAQLKKEAEEAARRLEEARKAALAKSATVGIDPDSLSADDVAAATTKGGSMPVKSGYRVGAGFGATGSWSRYHTGQDFPAPSGTKIYAAASGIVLSPTSGSWAGINVVIQHNNGGATLYAHMSKRVVKPGQAVKAGQLIGYVGNTGRSFGSHLHFEYYKPGVTPGDVYSASNPISFLRSLGVR